MNEKLSPSEITADLGERLKQARLNKDITQAAVAERAGVTRKTVINAEQGNVRLDAFVAIMAALGLTRQLDLFLPEQPASPVQLARRQAGQRQRASGKTAPTTKSQTEW